MPVAGSAPVRCGRWRGRWGSTANASSTPLAQAAPTEATGFAPIDYVQRLRIEDAKRRLERTEAPMDEVSWQVGYEDPAFFRRLFRRTTGLAPGAYRRKFRVPSFAGQ